MASSRGAAAAVDKENVAPAGAPAARSTRRKGLGAMPAAGNVQKQQQQQEAGAEGGSVVKKAAAAAVQQQLPRLLLFTEKAEEVFMLGQGLPQAEEREQLARAVIGDRGSPGAWWRLLQHVGRVFGEADRCDAKHAPQIRKLYQKATRIIPESLYQQEGQSPALVGIWLGFAAAERRVSESDAKEAYEHMARCGIGDRAAAFYLQYAAFEEGCGRPEAATAILTQGLAKGAQPADALRIQLARLKGEAPPASAAAGAAGASSTTSPGATAGLDFDLEGIDLDLASVKSGGSSSSGSSSGGAGSSSSGGPKPSPPPAAPVQQQQEERLPVAAAKGSASPTSTVSSSTSSTSSSPPELPPPASVSKAAKPPIAPDAPSSTTKAPPPTPKQPPQALAPEGGGGSAVKAAAAGNEEKQAPRTASKTKRLIPTGRLLGLGRAERVRPAAEAAPTGKPKEEGGDGGGGGGSGGSTEAATATAQADGEGSTAPTPAPAPAPPSTPRPAGSSAGNVAVPSSFGRLQPITEDDGTGSGKGSEDTVGAGGLRASLPPASAREGEAGNSSTETRDLSVRLQKPTDDHAHTVIARTPAAKASIAPSSTPASRATITAPGSAARGGAAGSTTMPPPPPTGTSSRLRASPSEPQQQLQPVSMHSQQAYPPAHDADWTHTRDRGRRAAREDGLNLTADGGQQGQHGSLSEEEHSLTRPGGARRHYHDDGAAPVAVMAAVPLSASKPRGPPQHFEAAAAATTTAQPPPPHTVPAAALGPPASSGSAPGSFSFEALLASRNFMALNNAQYLRLDVLGRGGSSKVFRVLSDSGQVYALKRVRVPPKDTRALESFANEITLLARLRGHPCIIQLVDSHVCRQTGLVLMLMELGEIDLNKLIAQSAAEQAAAAAPVVATPGTGWRLSLNFVRFVWEQMLRAVQCVHAERIVHGDLKPANFVFVKGRLKLIDFGIAKALGNDTTNIMRESQVGTVNYMSPEAILDTGGGREHGGRRAPCMKIGRASDVWSLGCILYQLVYGKTPFAALNLIQKLHCIVDDGYRIPFPNEEALHPDVLDTIKRCLRRDPTQRPPIAGGAGSLLAHPFLCSGVSAAAPEAAAASGPLSEGARRWVVKATLAVVDSDPGVLRLERLERVGAVCERVGGLLGGGGGEEAATALPSVREKREEEEEEAAPAAATAAEGGAAARKDEGGEIEAAADHTGDSSESSKGGHPNSWSFN